MDEENNTLTSIGGFTKFVKSANRIVDKISVTTGGAVGFSTSFSNDHKLSDYVAATLYWNPETHEVGIDFTQVEGEGTLKLIANKNGYGYTLNAKAFFAVNHIDTKKYHGRYAYRVVPFNQLDPSYSGSRKMYIFGIREARSQQTQPDHSVAPVNEVVPAHVVGTEANQTPQPGM